MDEQDRKLKHRLKLPENSTIKLAKVKGSQQRYWYAYFWNPQLKKLKKIYNKVSIKAYCPGATVAATHPVLLPANEIGSAGVIKVN
jgi:hypothetical protein